MGNDAGPESGEDVEPVTNSESLNLEGAKWGCWLQGGGVGIEGCAEMFGAWAKFSLSVTASRSFLLPRSASQSCTTAQDVESCGGGAGQGGRRIV